MKRPPTESFWGVKKILTFLPFQLLRVSSFEKTFITQVDASEKDLEYVLLLEDDRLYPIFYALKKLSMMEKERLAVVSFCFVFFLFFIQKFVWVIFVWVRIYFAVRSLSAYYTEDEVSKILGPCFFNDSDFS